MTDNNLGFPRLNVRAKILITLLALSMISLILTGFFASATISDIETYAETSSTALGEQAVNDSMTALQHSAEEYMIQMVSDQASITDLLIWIAESEMRIGRSNAQAVQNNPSYTPVYPPRSPLEPPADPRSASVYFFAPGSAATTGSEEFRALIGMTDIFHAMSGNDPDLASIYVATDSGIMLLYPWNLPVDPNYDPRVRDWYTEAIKRGNLTWTGPYVDATGKGLIMTCSVPVYNPKYGYWVIATDMTIETINNEIINWTFGKSGYAVLMDNHGNIISRPGLVAGNVKWYETFRTENVFESDSPELRAVGANMTAGKTGIGRVWFNETEKFVAYAPIQTLNWSVAISLPVDEIIAPAVATRSKISTATQATKEHINDETNMVRNIFTVSFFILLAVVVVLAVLFARVITKPVESLKAATTALGEGNLDYHVAIRTGDEFEELGESFNRMAADLRKNLEDLRRTTAEKERYTKELEIAKSIQKSFLPDTVPSIPGFEIAAFTLPAMEIGGDFYDFIQVSDDRWGLVIADVSGKGVSAAIFMALSRTLMHASGGTHPDPKAAVRRANRLIHAEAKSSMFVTLFYGVLDARKMTLSYVNAGHNPPLLVRGEPASVLSLEGKGAPMALGVRPDVYMEEDILGLQRGDLVVMYTDGVTEALNEKDEIFGEERLTGFVRANRSRPAQENITALVQEIKRFIGDAPQSDDITLLVLQVK